MTDLSRRSFLRGFVAVTAAAVVAPAVLAHANLPMIVGDGIHDDAAGLNAALNGRPFLCPSNLVREDGGVVTLQGGLYRISHGITLEDVPTTIFVSDGRFVQADNFDGSPMLTLQKQTGDRGVFTRCLLDASKGDGAAICYA